MIDIVVHGTKGGYKVLYPKEPRIPIYDVRPDNTEGFPDGSYTYSLRLFNGDIIASKYVIAKDPIGDSRTGNIAFSVVIPRAETMPGRSIKALLDDLHDAFLKNGYMKDDEITRKTIDDSVITAIIHEYANTNNRANLSNMSSGNSEAAYLYYHNDDEVCKLFDWPYQEAYTRYRQVFFVSEKYEDQRNNPLGALKHTANADLSRLLSDLEYYKLDYSKREGIELKIKNNENVLVEAGAYLKKDSYLIGQFVRKYYEPIVFRGIIRDLDHKFISINFDCVTINYPNNDDWIKEQKEIRFKIVNESGVPYDNAIIEVIDFQKCYAANEPLVLKGEDIGKKIRIKIIIDENSIKSVYESEINPTEFTDNKKTLQITIKSQRSISYSVFDYNGNALKQGQYKIRIDGLAGGRIDDGNQIIRFIGDKEINNEWIITVDGGSNGGRTTKFVPNNTNHIKIDLLKPEISSYTPPINIPREYYIDAGKHGHCKNHQHFTTYDNPISFAINQVKANFGWNIDEKQTYSYNNHNNRTINIQYKKAWCYFLTRWWFYVSTIILLLIVLLIPTISGNSEKDLVLQEINGDKITIAQLNKYKADYCKTTDENQSEGFIGIIKKAFKHDDSQLCSTIDKALESLTCINEGRLEEYKEFNREDQSKSHQITLSIDPYRNSRRVIDTLNKYFKTENLLNTTIDSLVFYIGDMAKLADYDSQIPSLINSSDCNKRLNEINQNRFNNRIHFTFYYSEVKKRLNNKKAELEQLAAAQQKAEADRLAAEQQRIANETAEREKQIKDIKAYLRGNMLTKDRLKHDLDKHVSTNIDNSIKLCLEFWDVFNKDSVKTDDFSTNVSKLRAKVSADSNIGSSSELYKFLNTLCTDQSALEKIKSIRATAWSNINTLQHLIDKSK